MYDLKENTNTHDTVPKSGFSDLFALIACFVSLFFLPTFLVFAFFGEHTAFRIGTGFGLFFSMLPVYLMTMLYVRRTTTIFSFKSLLLTLCYTAVLFSVAVHSFYFLCVVQLILFIYLTGALCTLRSDSLSLKDDTYPYLIEELRQIFLIPVKKVFLPFRSLLKSVRFKRSKKLGGIVFGCLLSLPVLLVVGELLISGDAAFSNATSSVTDSLSDFFTKLFDSFADRDYILHIYSGFFTSIVFSPFVFSMFFGFRHGIQRSQTKKTTEKIGIRAFVSSNVATGFYVMLCILYALYLFSQLSYFFGAFSGKIPLAVNMSLSEYARRGFFEMSAIAAINLALIAFGVICVKRKESGKITPLFKGIFTFLDLFTILLIITAISKMALYITEMGLTHKRILVCIADLLLTVILVCILIRLYRKSFPYMKIIVSVCLAVMSLYALFGDSALIASFNTNAYLKGYHNDLDIETVAHETTPYHAIKNLRKVAEDKDDVLRLVTGDRIGQIIFHASDCYLPEKKLEMNTAENLLTSESITDFLFWEYAKDNRDFIMKHLNSFREYIDWQGEY